MTYKQCRVVLRDSVRDLRGDAERAFPFESNLNQARAKIGIAIQHRLPPSSSLRSPKSSTVRITDLINPARVFSVLARGGIKVNLRLAPRPLTGLSYKKSNLRLNRFNGAV